MRTLKDKLNHPNPQRREKVEVRVAQLIGRGDDQAGAATSRKLTQVRLAKALGITQNRVSHLEKRADLLRSTCVTMRRTLYC
jgi:transcriptional regulator